MGGVAPLTAAQRRALAGLKREGVLGQVYLAGGVAVAEHLRHRKSNDLDFFSLGKDLDLDEIRRRTTGALQAAVVAQSDATLKLQLKGAMVDFVRYPYPPLGRLKPGPEGVSVAGIRDLAVMKLAAIARRGVRRDYWDLYEILTRTRVSLRSACDDYLAKYGVSEADLYHVLRALGWFEEAEADASHPQGLTRQKWASIREWFEQRAARELRRRAGGE